MFFFLIVIAKEQKEAKEATEQKGTDLFFEQIQNCKSGSFNASLSCYPFTRIKHSDSYDFAFLVPDYEIIVRHLRVIRMAWICARKLCLFVGNFGLVWFSNERAPIIITEIC
jgi:hypothetical protein